jgi:hypothetical protein
MSQDVHQKDLSEGFSKRFFEVFIKGTFPSDLDKKVLKKFQMPKIE